MTRYSNNDGDEMVLVSCTIERESARAYLIETEDRAEHWVPKSQSSKVSGGLKIKKWLIEKNNILVGHHQLISESEPDDLVDNDRGADDYDRIPDSAYREDDIPF